MLVLVNSHGDDNPQAVADAAADCRLPARQVPGRGSDEVDARTPAPQPQLPSSLDQFFAAISARAFRFAEIGLRQREDALDAVQEAMIKMLNYRDKPAAEWTPLFWSILRSRIIDIQRRRTFRLRWLAPSPSSRGDEDDDRTIDWADDGPDPSRAHDGREGYARLVEALRELPQRQREAFSLRVLEELDVATAARAMGCSEGSVKTHLFRARATLQEQLEDWR